MSHFLINARTTVYSTRNRKYRHLRAFDSRLRKQIHEKLSFCRRKPAPARIYGFGPRRASLRNVRNPSFAMKKGIADEAAGIRTSIFRH
jgi:hypothetical protein